MSPRSASERKHIRHSRNFRMNERGRPHSGQRLRWRTLNFWCRELILLSGSSCDKRAMLAPERHAQRLEQRARVIVSRRRGHDRNVEPLDLVDAIEVDLGEDDLLFDAERIISAAI